MQRNCIFPGRYAPLTYYDWLRGRPRNMLMAIMYVFIIITVESSAISKL